MESRIEILFRWIWRINALLVLGLGLGALATIAVVTLNGGIFGSRDRPERNVRQVAGADIRADDLELGQFQEIRGTKLLYASLAAKSDEIASGSSYGRGDARNLLFFDTTTKKVYWLLKGNEQRIPSVAFITDPATEDYEYSTSRPCGKDLTTLAILLEIVPFHNGEAPNPSERKLVIASPDGTGIVTVADKIDGLLGKHRVSADLMQAFYSSGGSIRVAEIELIAKAVRSDSVLAEGN